MRSLARQENQCIQRRGGKLTVTAFCPQIFKYLRELCFVDESELIQSLTTRISYQRLFQCEALASLISKYTCLEAALKQSEVLRYKNYLKLRQKMLGGIEPGCLEFVTDDNKFVVRIVSEKQRKVLVSQIMKIYHHVKYGKRLSFIRKYYGVYEMSGGPIAHKVNVLVFHNSARPVRL